jgi:hypothetical protein
MPSKYTSDFVKITLKCDFKAQNHPNPVTSILQ